MSIGFAFACFCYPQIATKLQNSTIGKTEKSFVQQKKLLAEFISFEARQKFRWANRTLDNVFPLIFANPLENNFSAISHLMFHAMR